MKKIYSWNTKKTKGGYEYKVKELTPRKKPNKMGHYIDTKTIKSGLKPTRARAKGLAQRWARYYYVKGWKK